MAEFSKLSDIHDYLRERGIRTASIIEASGLKEWIYYKLRNADANTRYPEQREAMKRIAQQFDVILSGPEPVTTRELITGDGSELERLREENRKLVAELQHKQLEQLLDTKLAPILEELKELRAERQNE